MHDVSASIQLSSWCATMKSTDWEQTKQSMTRQAAQPAHDREVHKLDLRALAGAGQAAKIRQAV